MLKKIKIFLFVFIFPLLIFSQNEKGFEKIDSLEVLLQQSGALRAENKMYEALEAAFKAVDYAHKLEHNHYLSYGYFMMGIVQYQIIDYKNAKRHLLKALEFTEKTEDKILLPYILHNLANIYYDDNSDFENALIYYKRAVDLGKQNPHIGNYQTPLNSLIWTYMDLNRFNEAAIYLKEADSLHRATPDSITNYKSSYYLLKARDFVHNGKFEEAEEYFEKAYKIIEKQDFWPKGKSYFYQYRYKMYEKTGDFSKAIADLKKLRENDQKVFENAQRKNEEITKIRFKVDEYERKLEASEREKTLLQNIQKNDKIIIYFSLASLILLMGVVFFYYKGYVSKKKSSEILESKNIELRNAKMQAEKLSKIKSQFISTVSHELRTPLYGVIGISSLLLENEKNSNDDKELLSSLKFSADYLLNLVNKVLKISKIDSEKTNITIAPTNLFSLSKNILKTFEYQSSQKQNELILEYNHNIPDLLEIDPLHISEILINLIGNAIKFTQNGKILLRVQLRSIGSKSARIRFEVEDTGIGIPDDQKEYIFEEFSQVGSVYDNKQGTGLGLSIVKNLLHRMDSKIQFESSKNIGSKFYFDLDLKISDQVIDVTNDSANSGSFNYLKSKVLLAEDNKINQLVTKKLLNKIGCDCTIVENGSEAIKVMEKEKFDLILMDINMPVLDGMQATLEIRKFDTTTPIIALTASELSEVEDECRKAGMNDLINKPLNKVDLRNAISSNLVKSS